MKKVSLFLVGLVLAWALCSCSTEEVNPGAAASEPTVAVGKVRSVGEALSELEAVLDHLDAPTRAGGQRTYSLDKVAVAGGSAATRGEEGDALPDTLAYVVNFDDGEGFAVLGALRNSAPVYAVTEKGTMDAARLNEAIAQAYARLTASEEAGSQTRAAEESEIREIGIDIVPQLLAQVLVLEATALASGDGEISGWGNTPKNVYLRTEYSDWTLGAIIGPCVITKWDQGYPFNMACAPLPPGYVGEEFKEHRGRCAVGCVILAVGQLTACTQHPRVIPSLPVSCTWNDLKSVSNYSNFTSFNYRTVDDFFAANPSEKTKCQYLATYLYTLWDIKYCMATPGVSTGSTIRNARNALLELDYNYYKNATIKGMSFDPTNLVNNLNDMYAMLDESKPVFVRGDGATGGHAWLIDGYQRRSRWKTDYYRKNSGEVYDISALETNNLVHCNWGYQGYCDGYYEVGIFTLNPSTYREEWVDKDVPYDPMNNHYIGKDYSVNNQMIIY